MITPGLLPNHPFWVWDLETGKKVGRLDGPWMAVAAARRRSVSVDASGTLRLGGLKNAQPLRAMDGHTETVNLLRWELKGARLFLVQTTRRCGSGT
jgi:hypothetical protein